MRQAKLVTRIQLALLVLLLAACGAPRATSTAPMASPTVDQAPTAPLDRMEYSGISFTYNRALAARVAARRVSPAEHMGTDLPEYIQFDFDPDHTHAFPGRDTGIRVFRVRDLQQVNSMYQAAVTAHEPMPLINASRVLRVQEKLLSFLNGKGERAIVHYAQDIGPLTNEGLFYSYQGVTDNGLYYVSATFPVAAAFLPETFADSFPGMPAPNPGEPGSIEAYADAANRFNLEATERLDQLDTTHYQPSLEQFDAMIRSLFAGEAPEWSAGPE